MNSITENMQKGTIGELLVQLRLLEHGVQAAPPIKDSGNDLIGIRGEVFKAIQVKTTASEYYEKPDVCKKYHILAVVKLVANETELLLDESLIFLVPQEQVSSLSTRIDVLSEYRLDQAHLNSLFDVRN